MSNILLSQEALLYARLGWPVIPLWWPLTNRRCSCGNPKCSSIGKHPIQKGWQDKATTDEAIIKRWLKQWPKANIGIVTGERSGILLLDVDGQDGADALVVSLLKLFDRNLPTFHVH